MLQLILKGVVFINDSTSKVWNLWDLLSNRYKLVLEIRFESLFEPTHIELVLSLVKTSQSKKNLPAKLPDVSVYEKEASCVFFQGFDGCPVTDFWAGDEAKIHKVGNVFWARLSIVTLLSWSF